MAQVTNERLAELIAWEEADIPDYQAVNDEAGARCVKDSLDLIAALRELVKRRAKLSLVGSDSLAGVEGALATALWMLERWEASGLGRDAPSLAEQTKNFLLSVRLSAADSKEG